MTRDAEHTPNGYEDAASVVVNQAPAPSSLAGGEVDVERAPNFGFETNEPSLRQVIEFYYRSHGMENWPKLAAQYCAALSPEALARDVQGLVRPDAMAGRRWRHKGRGTTYTSLGFGKAQCSPSGLLDDENVVIYQGDDGSLWARRHAEFSDGRFEEIEALTPRHEAPASEGDAS